MFKSKKVQNTALLNDLGDHYHTYDFFGLSTEYKHKNLYLNQKSKGPILAAFMAKALAFSKEKSDYSKVSFMELFCADAFYAMQAYRLGYDEVHGLDNNKDDYSDYVKEVASRLNIPLTFHINDISSIKSAKKKYDVVANIGGLYHVDNPEDVLKWSYDLANKYLIVQNVVSLSSSSKKYYKAPAPGWDWGNRYSKQSFDNLIREKLGYKIIDSHFNILQGNENKSDQGCVFYLVEKK